MNFSKTININCTPEQLWNSLTDFEKARQWNSCLLENEKITEGEIGRGSRSRSLIREGKKSVWYEEEILEYAPYERLKMKLSGKNLGKNPMLSDYQLKDTGNGVQLTQAIEWLPSGLMLKLFHRMIEKMSKKNVERELNNLRQYLESDE